MKPTQTHQTASSQHPRASQAWSRQPTDQAASSQPNRRRHTGSQRPANHQPANHQPANHHTAGRQRSQNRQPANRQPAASEPPHSQKSAAKTWISSGGAFVQGQVEPRLLKVSPQNLEKLRFHICMCKRPSSASPGFRPKPG